MKQIKGFKDYYIDINGNIFSFKYGKKRKLKQWNGGYGYLNVSLWKNQKEHRKKVHRIVAETYLENPNNYNVVCHKNDKRTDNRISNLYWGTGTSNMLDAYRNGLRHNKKITDKEVLIIREEIKQGYLQRELSLKYGVSQQHISRIKNKKRRMCATA